MRFSVVVSAPAAVSAVTVAAVVVTEVVVRPVVAMVVAAIVVWSVVVAVTPAVVNAVGHRIAMARAGRAAPVAVGGAGALGLGAPLGAAVLRLAHGFRADLDGLGRVRGARIGARGVARLGERRGCANSADGRERSECGESLQ
jgi:hypothetical protein